MKKHLSEYLLIFDKGHGWVTQTPIKIHNLPPPQKALPCSFPSAPSATSPRRHLVSSHHRLVQWFQTVLHVGTQILSCIRTLSLGVF